MKESVDNVSVNGKDDTSNTNGNTSENERKLDTKTPDQDDNKNEIVDKKITDDEKETNGKSDTNKVDDVVVTTEVKKFNTEKKNENDMIEIEDPDDYLIYLEDILKRIHQHFYEKYDGMESGEVPDLKKVIPKVRSQVLKNCKMVFSGLVPTRTRLEHSKAYQVARSLGAIVTQDLDEETTHLVAVRPGTVKVNAGRKKKNLKIVTPDWLWCCAER